MATSSTVPQAGSSTPADGTPTTTPSPTTTRYQELANQFSAQLDELLAIIPNMEASHVSIATFVRSHLNVPTEFLATAIAAVEQTPELDAVGKLNVVAARDTLQFIEAFRPIHDKIVSVANRLKFTLNSRRATLAADSLQIYNIAKGVARDPASADVAAHVANMKRDLGRRGRPKGTTTLKQPGPLPPTRAAVPAMGESAPGPEPRVSAARA
jgi:hypothetical protein